MGNAIAIAWKMRLVKTPLRNKQWTTQHLWMLFWTTKALSHSPQWFLCRATMLPCIQEWHLVSNLHCLRCGGWHRLRACIFPSSWQLWLFRYPHPAIFSFNMSRMRIQGLVSSVSQVRVSSVLLLLSSRTWLTASLRAFWASNPLNFLVRNSTS